MRARVVAQLDDLDEVSADCYAASTRGTRFGIRVPVPAWMHVQLGDGLELCGAPEVVLRVLEEALLSAREAAGTEDCDEGFGGEA